MGMYDSVCVSCPECGTLTEIQSKAGSRVLGSYSLDNAPPEILFDIGKRTHWCILAHPFHIRIQSIIQAKPFAGEYPEYEDTGWRCIR